MSEKQQQELYHLFGSLCNETITAEEHDRLQSLLTDDADVRLLYFQYLDLHLELGQQVSESIPVNSPPAPMTIAKKMATAKKSHLYLVVGLLALVILAVGLLFNNLFLNNDNGNHLAIATVLQTSQVQFAGDSHSLKVGSPLELQHKYALIEGELQIHFASGAEVILKGPAVFEVQGNELLSVDYGDCSVHAPPGAEGFTVLTPLSKVVDLGTRFSVNVNESGQTEVQVIEGEAEVHRSSTGQSVIHKTARLTEGMARRYTHDHELIVRNIPYNRSAYTEQLPDRIINYTATTGKHGGVEKLTGITVQRGGKKITYQTDQLIGIEVTHFKGVPSGRGYFTTGIDQQDPALNLTQPALRRGLLDGDDLLTTGLINPGGSLQPLTSDPIMFLSETKAQPNTPGMAIHFKTPVINQPGPDVVLFDLHVIVHPVHGDHFHVSPLQFKKDLHSHTIRQFDINLSSAEAKKIDQFNLYSFEKIVGTLKQLESFKHNGGTLHVVGAKALATGIDFSDMGYQEGDAVKGIFIQDALSPGGHLDPVFIAGFPEIIDNSK